ncbi:MAG: LPS assembly protein LptD [Bdellovibrionales bacterium]|jgi:LPS-assembly protein
MALPMATPCLAMPPLGYVGPVSRAEIPSMPPLGYVGPVPSSEMSSISSTERVEPTPVLETASFNSLSESANPKQEHPGETLISAKQMHSDSETGIVTALGQVEVVYNDYILHADKVSYNQTTGILTADGNVALLTPTGDVQFSQHQEITGDMKQAFARNIGILFPDNSRIAAKTGQRYNERYTVAEHALYTACNICRENPDKEPLWQLEADTVTHDSVRHKVYYHDVTINFAGVPVVYTPYMSAPDPTVKRLQGFLSPLPGISPNIGEFIKIPYYFDIAPNKDMTVTPTFSTKDKLQLDVQYRQRFNKSDLKVEGSITKAKLINDAGIDKGQQWRGHLFGTFLANFNDDWRGGTDIQYVSDKSYLPRYAISSIDQTTSRAYAEGFFGRNYTVVNSYYFQNLRAGSNTSEPVVLPSVSFSALGDPKETWGGRWSLDGNTLVTSRSKGGKTLVQQGPDTRRLSLKAGWERQFISDIGLEATISGLVRADSYWADNVVASNKANVYDRASFTRQFEQANAVVRYPMGRSGDGYQHLLEPIAAITLAPTVRTIAKQPLEDSFDVEFDETNLFSPNRYTGSDLIEGGSRATYGVRNMITGDDGARIDIFGGQSYNFTTNSNLVTSSGISGHASDYVGRIDFSPAEWLTANYGFRLSEDDLSPQRQDASLSVGAPIFRPSLRYIQAYQLDTTTNLYNQVRQMTLGFSSKFAKYWALTGVHTQSFDPQPGPRSSGLALTYNDECFAFGINLSRDNTSRADISSGTSIAFHFYLKNLGGLRTDSGGGIAFPAEFRQTAP